MNTSTDLASQLIEYESGELDDDAVVLLFQRLIDSGMAWKLQGSYGRMARSLIDSGHCHMPCDSCDCADPLALPGLANDCDCTCHVTPRKEVRTT